MILQVGASGVTVQGLGLRVFSLGLGLQLYASFWPALSGVRKSLARHLGGADSWCAAACKKPTQTPQEKT